MRVESHSCAGQRVLADEKVARPKSRRAFQKQNRPQRRQGRGEPRTLQFARGLGSPKRNGKFPGAGKLLGGRRQISILHPARLAKNRGEQCRLRRERRFIWRGIKFVEKICQTTVERIAINRELRDLCQCFRPHILPSSNRPSTRYCVFTGMRLAG